MRLSKPIRKRIIDMNLVSYSELATEFSLVKSSLITDHKKFVKNLACIQKYKIIRLEREIIDKDSKIEE